MTVKEILADAKERMGKSVESYREDLRAVRAGRANPQVLDRITVDYYGSQTPINGVSNISAPEPRMLMISPWDPKMINEIIKAIQRSDLGLNPTTDGKVIRLVFPVPSEERRKELTKTVRKGAEDAKVAVRNIRRDAIERIKKLKKDSEITEDDQKDAETEAQKITDAAIKEVDAVCEAKVKEIMDV